jgi:hypothetical protein
MMFFYFFSDLIRVIISILYTIIEFARQINEDADEQWTNFQQLLKSDLCMFK